MDDAPPPPAMVAMVPFLEFAALPLPQPVFAEDMGGDPLLVNAAESTFHAVTGCLPWTPVPAAPANPTSFTCLYSDIEGLLHGVFNMNDTGILSTSPFLRYILPRTFCQAWDVLVEVGGLDTTKPFKSPTLTTKVP
jgi:hypothetical protein